MISSNKGEVNKKYFFGYLAFLSVGVINFGYFVSECSSLSEPEEVLYFLSTYFAKLFGNILSGVFPRASKRRKMLISNIIIIIFSATLSIFGERSKLSMNMLSALIGIGFGITATTLPFFLKEIAPKEYQKTALISFGVMVFVGIQLNGIASYIVTIHELDGHLWLFLFPSLLSSIQLLLQLIMFRDDTPKWLANNSLEEEAVMVIAKFYHSTDRRIKEYNILQINTANYKLQWPTYTELFTGQNLNNLLKGMVVLLARNATEDFILTDLEMAANDLTLFVSLCVTAIFIAITVFILANKLSMRKAFVIGGIPLALIMIGFIVMDIIGLVTEFKDYELFTNIFIAMKWVVHSLFISPFCFMYAIKLLPERGFTLLIAFHWISFLLLHLPYIFVFDSGRISLMLIMSCLFAACVIPFVVLIFKESKGLEL